MKKLLLILIIFLSLTNGFSQVDNNEIFRLGDIPDNGIILDNYLQTFDDSTLRISFIDILNKPADDIFHSNTSSQPFSNTNRLVRWGRLILRNEKNISRACFFEFFRFDTIEVYFPDAEGYKKNLAGYGVGKSNLAVADNPRFVPFTIPPGSTQIIFFRFELKKPYYFWSPVSITLLSDKMYLYQKDLVGWMFGFFTGLSAAMCIVLLLFFVAFNDRNFINLIFYIFLSNIYLLFSRSVPFDVNGSLFRHYEIIPFEVALVTYAYINFIFHFLSFKNHYPLFHKIVWIVIWLFILNNSLGIFLIPYGTAGIITNFGGILWLILLLIAVCLLMFKNVSYLKYIAFSVFISVAGNIINVMAFANIIRLTTFTKYAALFGNSIQFVTFSYVLIAKVLTVRREKAEYQLKVQQAELEKQRAQEDIRSKISMDLHDEIGSQLTKISLLSQRIKLSYENKKEIDANTIDKISASSKEVVDNLGEIIWTVNPKHDNLQSLLAYLRNYITNFFEQTNVDCTINFPDEMPAVAVSPELKHNLFLVIKESLNNIIKHAAATEVKIGFEYNGEVFCFYITDYGKGIVDLNGRDFGNGLINMRNRMEAVSGKFEIESGKDKGTKIFLEGKF